MWNLQGGRKQKRPRLLFLRLLRIFESPTQASNKRLFDGNKEGGERGEISKSSNSEETDFHRLVFFSFLFLGDQPQPYGYVVRTNGGRVQAIERLESERWEEDVIKLLPDNLPRGLTCDPERRLVQGEELFFFHDGLMRAAAGAERPDGVFSEMTAALPLRAVRRGLNVTVWWVLELERSCSWFTTRGCFAERSNGGRSELRTAPKCKGDARGTIRVQGRFSYTTEPLSHSAAHINAPMSGRCSDYVRTLTGRSIDFLWCIGSGTLTSFRWRALTVLDLLFPTPYRAVLYRPRIGLSDLPASNHSNDNYRPPPRCVPDAHHPPPGPRSASFVSHNWGLFHLDTHTPNRFYLQRCRSSTC